MSDNKESDDNQPTSSSSSNVDAAGNNSNSNSNNNQMITSGKRNFLEVNDLQKYKQFVLKPLDTTKKFKPSETLSKVKDFLPLLRESTNKLLTDFKEKPDEINIENVDDEDEHIEMNLAMVSDDDDDSDEDEDEDDEEEDDDDDDDDEEEGENELCDHRKVNFFFAKKNFFQSPRL